MIDPGQGLVFSSEKELLKYFENYIDFLDKEFSEFAKNSPTGEIPVENGEEILNETLDTPSEIWHDETTFKEFPIFHFIRPLENHQAYHVAVTYISSDDEPTFVFIHFVIKDLDLLQHYRRGTLIYDRAFEEVEFGALEGDSLSEGDPLAMGLFISMLKVRSEKEDIPKSEFQSLGNELREETIQNADEIWKDLDLNGNQIVTFIKEFEDYGPDSLYYIALTQEDPSSQVHTLLFSFPTKDENLVDRYRRGANLQAEDVIQESSH